jgi:enoyl-[acyl-carrier protein] reductase II
LLYKAIDFLVKESCFRAKCLLELEKYTLGSLKKAVFEGNVDEGSLMAGQVAGMIHEIKPVKQILEEMMSELQETYSNLEI